MQHGTVTGFRICHFEVSQAKAEVERRTLRGDGAGIYLSTSFHPPRQGSDPAASVTVHGYMAVPPYMHVTPCYNSHFQKDLPVV